MLPNANCGTITIHTSEKTEGIVMNEQSRDKGHIEHKNEQKQNKTHKKETNEQHQPLGKKRRWTQV